MARIIDGNLYKLFECHRMDRRGEDARLTCRNRHLSFVVSVQADSQQEQESIMTTTGILATATAALALASTAVDAQDVRSGYIDANGVDYYYEIRGSGEPLLLLHGGLGSTGMFEPIMPQLTEHRQVIAVDLQGHGRTALGDRPFSLQAMGADMAVVLDKLGHKQVDVFGYSMGGGVAFQLAVQRPETVRRLVLVSAGYSQDGFYPEMLPMQAQVGAAMADSMKDTPMYKSLRGRQSLMSSRACSTRWGVDEETLRLVPMSPGSGCRSCSYSATATCTGLSMS